MFLNVQELATTKLGVTADTVKTGRFADALTIMRPKSADELALFQSVVDWIYDEFVGKVAESRRLDPVVVREIAQGRVWSGLEAKKLGLVDEIGGLADAVKYAAAKAKLGDAYRVTEYPRRKEFMETLTAALEGKRREKTAAGPLGTVMGEAERLTRLLGRLNDPRGVYARLPFDLTLP
jgi:protease-4